MEIETVSTRVVYENRWTRVREDEIVRADGTPGLYGVVEKPNFAVVIPATETGFWMVEQYRYPVRGRYLEFPQGANEDEPDIDPADLARQELEEETGLRAANMLDLGSAFLAYGICNHQFHSFLATELTSGDTHRSVEEQGMETLHVTREEFLAHVKSGRIKDGATLTAYNFLRLHEDALGS